MSLMMENLRNNATVFSSSDEDERPDGDPFEAEGRHAVVSFNVSKVRQEARLLNVFSIC